MTGVASQLQRIERGSGAGSVKIGRDSVAVTNLGKKYFPKPGYTKGDLLRYYAAMSEYVLPVMKDRPLVLKRYPGGVKGNPFYQQQAPDPAPPGVRVEGISNDDGATDLRIVGGNLATLLYTIQLGAISVDPWHGRWRDTSLADYSVIDLDPGDGTTFRKVVRVARWVKEVLDELRLPGVAKTSGASGVHVFVPLKPDTPAESARLVAELIATRVSEEHPKDATVVRAVKRRPRGTVYVDYLQNIAGKTVAGAYAVRAEPTATVSTPLKWEELTGDLDPRAFTIATMGDRVSEVGDLWREGMRRKASLKRIVSG